MNNIDVVLVSVENGWISAQSIPILDAYLSRERIKTRILYPRIKGYSVKDLVNEIVELNPKVVGIGGLYDDRFYIREIISSLDPYRKNFKIVVGGNIITPTPEFMVGKLSADIGVIGEGEITFTRLVKKILEREDFTGIKGIAFKDGNNVISTGHGEYIENLDELPLVDYQKIPMEYFINIYQNSLSATCTRTTTVYLPSTRMGMVMTGRGCLYKCNFCYQYSKLRFQKISSVIAQIKELKKRFNINTIRIADDLALVNKKRTLELCRAFIDEKLDVKYLVNAHFHCLDEEMVIALKESGCVQIGLGLESGSQNILDKIHKNVKVEQIINGLSLLNKYKMNWNGCIQVGQIDETPEDVKKTIDVFYPFCNDLSTISVAITTPFPGTHLYHHGLKTGLINSDEEMFNKLEGTTGLSYNFSKIPDWKIRYLKLSLAFKFDLKKQIEIRGKWKGIYTLSKTLAMKGINKFINITTSK
jgi:radical SAM superfamily enzyme YgiQ (UPF0313 family)